jgi:hypothetical protein
MEQLPVSPAGEKPELDSWWAINLSWKPGGGVVSRRILLPVIGTLNVWKEVLRPTSSGAPEVGGKTGTEACSCSCPRSPL